VNWMPPEVSAEPERTPDEDLSGDWIDRWLDKLEKKFFGIRTDPDEFRKHLVSSQPPCYPTIARRAGVQGMVRLQVRATPDGRVEVDKILDGSPALADAAIDAVKRWRVKPFTANGKPVEVVSTVAFNFTLH